MIEHGRWRGQMPFRLNRTSRPEPLEQQGRGGEPSRASLRYWLDWLEDMRRRAAGKAAGSFTEHARHELAAWMKQKGLDPWHSPVSFQYRLYRRRTVLVTITRPRIYHRRIRGDGSKGFVLEGLVQSIDGLSPACRNQFSEFALNRVIGQHPIRLLMEGEALT